MNLHSNVKSTTISIYRIRIASPHLPCYLSLNLKAINPFLCICIYVYTEYVIKTYPSYLSRTLHYDYSLALINLSHSTRPSVHSFTKKIIYFCLSLQPLSHLLLQGLFSSFIQLLTELLQTSSSIFFTSHIPSPTNST